MSDPYFDFDAVDIAMADRLVYIMELKEALRAAVGRCARPVLTFRSSTHEQLTPCHQVAPDRKCPPCRLALALLDGSDGE